VRPPLRLEARVHDAAGVTLLVFRLEGREHALPVEDVVEVLRMVAAAPLPEAPPWVDGVINLRGRAIPLVDLRSRLGAPRREPDVSTPIIVVQARDAAEVATGLVVDEVVEVLELGSEAMASPAPVTASSAVAGVAREGDRLILVLDRERLCAGSVDHHLPGMEGTRDAGR
jgi:purine-binding chemotaxis protein CheW